MNAHLRDKTIDAAALADRLRPGMTVYCAGGMSHPGALVEALLEAPASTRGVRFIVTRAPGFGQPWLRAPAGRIVTFFADPSLAGCPELELVPMQYRRIYDFLSTQPIDLALTQLAPPDEAGRCSFGLGVDFLPALLDSKDRNGQPCPIIAELNATLPSPLGIGTVALDRLEAVVLSRRPAPKLDRDSSPGSLEIGRRIAEHVASLIDDCDCLQTGIGAIPDAVLAAVVDRKDLGFHSGMASDGVLELARSGALSGARKSRDRGQIVVGFLYGSDELYSWGAEAPELSMRPVSYTHDPAVIADLDRFVAINSAIEVDLFGQVNAERVGGRQVSGTGGSIDFCRGAGRSRGGRSIVALPSTAAGGTRSRIVATLGEGAVATLTRTDVDFVVTEHGVAELRGRGERQRAEALIAIADPSFRDELDGSGGA